MEVLVASSKTVWNQGEYKEEHKDLTTIHASTAERLSFKDFVAEVISLRPATAVFDCDGTLWKEDSGYRFMAWSIAEGLLSRNASDWIDSRYRLYLAGKVEEIPMCGEMVQVYDGLRESEVRRAAGNFFRSSIEESIFPEMRELVSTLTRSGTEIWAVSSTNNWVLEEGLRSFSIAPERILAARVKVVDGIITSELMDVPSDEGKALSLRRAGLPSPDVVFGNSIHDLAMMEMARRPFPVNPTPELLRRAESKGWTVFYPAAVLPDPASFPPL